MKKELTALEAKYEAQKIAFAPLYFQAVVALRKNGILKMIGSERKGITFSELQQRSGISEYGIRVLLEAAESADIVEFIEENKVKLTKVGTFINSDQMTDVNINFVHDICYEGGFRMNESIQKGKPEGLKALGEWPTVYVGLSQLTDQQKKSWFEFDHYYSDQAFLAALKIVLAGDPGYIFDIGGNTGKWAIACCQEDPQVKVKILDLPGQLAVAEQHAKTAGFSDRIDFHEINVLDTSQLIPKGADAVWMSQFLDCFSKEEILGILTNVHQAVDEKADVYILEPFVDNQKFEAAKYCLTGTSLYFTAIANGNSKMYSTHEMEKLANEAGFDVKEWFPLIGDSYHTIMRCRKKG